MKKNIFKKLTALVATAAMAVCAMVAMPTEAQAADQVYLMGAFNKWSFTSTLTSTDGTNYTGEVDLAQENNLYILTEKDVWTSDGSMTSINGAETAWTDNDGHNCVWIDGSGDNAGTYTITWNKTTGALTATLKAASTTEYTYSYYVAGEAGLEAELWSNNDPSKYATKGKMTASGTKWTYTATTSASFDGTAGYNIIEIGTPDDDSAMTISWLKDGDAAFKCDYKGEGTLTITFDSEAKTSTCTFVAKSTGNDGAGTGNGSAGTTGGSDTADMAPVVAMVAVAALAAVVVLKKRTVMD